MTIPWLTRLPTPEEVAEHAKAHPLKGALFTWGVWLQILPDELHSWPKLWHLRRHNGVVTDNKWGNVAFTRSDEGTRFLPCTAEGIPICFVENAPEEKTPRPAPVYLDDERWPKDPCGRMRGRR